MGAKQVPIIGLEDKRQITAVLAIALDGRLLPPQLLHEGKTNRCHPNVVFPEGWPVWHSSNHWSNSSTMLEYINQLLTPWLEKRREELQLRPTQHALIA